MAPLPPRGIIPVDLRPSAEITIKIFQGRSANLVGSHVRVGLRGWLWTEVVVGEAVTINLKVCLSCCCQRITGK